MRNEKKETIEIYGIDFSKKLLDKIYSDEEYIKEVITNIENRFFELIKISMEQIMQLSIFINKSLLLLNGMSIVSIMTYIGNNSNYNKEMIINSLSYFIMGAIVSIVAATIQSYGIMYTSIAIAEHSKEKKKKKIKYSIIFSILIFIVSSFSLLCFAKGAYDATEGISSNIVIKF